MDTGNRRRSFAFLLIAETTMIREAAMMTKTDMELEWSTDCVSIQYVPRTDRVIYDLCDLNGRIVKTGTITSETTRIDLSGIRQQPLVVIIVDGDRVISQRQQVA